MLSKPSKNKSSDYKGLKQAFPDNHNIVKGLCQSLKNVNDYRLSILEKIKKTITDSFNTKKGLSNQRTHERNRDKNESDKV